MKFSVDDLLFKCVKEFEVADYIAPLVASWW